MDKPQYALPSTIRRAIQALETTHCPPGWGKTGGVKGDPRGKVSGWYDDHRKALHNVRLSLVISEALHGEADV